jgi:hypothetical protein
VTTTRPDAEQIVAAPPKVKRLGNPTPGAGIWGVTYIDFLPGDRRHWILPDGEVLDPAFDYARGVFTGTLDGQPWSSPWTPSLMWHIASQVPGYCTEPQGRKLHELAAEAGTAGGAVVEIGSAKGLSATWIGWGARSTAGDRARVWCVDTFQGPPGNPWRIGVIDDFKANIEYAGLRDTCVPVQKPSRQAHAEWDQPLKAGLIYVDAFHSYAQAKFDYEAWAQYALDGAVIAFDDCIDDFPSVMRLMRDLLEDPHLELLGRVDAMVYWRYRR